MNPTETGNKVTQTLGNTDKNAWEKRWAAEPLEDGIWEDGEKPHQLAEYNAISISCAFVIRFGLHFSKWLLQLLPSATCLFSPCTSSQHGKTSRTLLWACWDRWEQAVSFVHVSTAHLSVSWPFWAYLFSDTIARSNQVTSVEELDGIAREVAINFLVFGVVQALLENLREYGFMLNLASQMKHVQQRYFEAVFRQEMAWHDQQQATDLTDRLLSRLDRIQPVFNNSNFGLFLLTVSAIVSALILSLIESWRLTLVVCSVYPLVYLAFVWIAHVISQGSELGIKAFTAGTHIVSEDVGLIRTIRAFCTQHLEARRWVTRVWLSHSPGSQQQPPTAEARRCCSRMSAASSSPCCF